MKQPIGYGANQFLADSNVSRETFERLKTFADLLTRWNQKINLISRATEGDLWRRHILDSSQLVRYLPAPPGPVIDLGSGAGFPGLVLGILGTPEVTLIEADARKAAFLREAARETGTPVEIIVARIERVAPRPARAVTARAVAPLAQLLDLALPFLGPRTVGLFLKGQNLGVELTEAHKIWRMNIDRFPSQSDPSAFVVCVREVSRVQPV
ncbi:MAG: 16S rRNA (guanine(527)-N(7))-methyltransferase RsmG [Rhodospirillaceae bacterium]|nr:16S rRNA (guanine(527)-N(7))-methyltransferase RsmG [Rhodospirillaceae bacterium]